MGTRSVLLLGFRRGALGAAERLGLAVHVLHREPPARALLGRVASWGVADLESSPTETLERALELLDGRAVDAVLPSIEATVLPAAHVRARLGIGGNDPACARRCTDKSAMKAAVRAAGLACTDWREVGSDTQAGELIDGLGLPLVFKRLQSSGGRGQSLARDAREAREAIAPGMLAERFVHGREMSVESFVHEGRVLFENPTEYLVPRHANILPAVLEPRTLETIRELNRTAIRALGVSRGITHLELFLTETGVVFGEMAARPPGGRLMNLLRVAWGFDPWRAWVELELGLPRTFPESARRAAGSWMLHPGEGTVQRVGGLAEARATPHVSRVRCRVRPGDRIARRLGTGQDVGYLQAVAPDRDRVATALLAAHERLRFELAP